MKKTAIVLLLILVMLYSTLDGTLFVKVARANPYSQAMYKGTINAPSQPIITISSAFNNSVYNKNSLSIHLSVNVTWKNDEVYQQFISRVYYKLDWLSDESFIYKYYNADSNNIQPPIIHLDYTLNLTEIPNGKHSITFYAIEGGYYYPSLFEYYMISSNVSSIVVFTIDTIQPDVSILSIEDRIHNSSSVPLEFFVNKPTSQLSYVLDDQHNVTIYGNTTLVGLSNGLHNVTLYAWDIAGNVGSSETTSFTIAKSEAFPTVVVVAVSVAVVIVVAAGLLVYFKKRKYYSN